MTENNKQGETIANVEQAVKNSEKNAKTPRKWWRYILAVFVLLLILLFAPLLFLMTEKGQSSAVAIAEHFVEGLTIGEVNGSLQNGLSVKDSRFVMNGVEINVGQADLHLHFACVLKMQACVKNVALKDTSVNVDTTKLPSSQPKESTPLGEIKLPLKITLDQVSLDNVHVKVDQLDVQLKHFQSGVVGQGRLFTLSPTSLAGLTLSLPPSDTAVEVAVVEKSAKKVAEKVTKVNGENGINWNEIKAQLAQPILNRMQPIQLPLDIEISQFQANDITLLQKGIDGKENELIHVRDVILAAQSNADKIALNRFEIESNRGNVSGYGEMQLSHHYPVSLSVNAKSLTMPNFEIPPSDISTTIQGHLFDTLSLDVQTSGAFKANAKGEIKLAEPRTPLKLTLNSPSLAFPFIAKKGEEQLQFKNINVDLRGDLLDYHLNAALSANGMGVPPSQATLQGKGGLTEFNLQSLSLNALDGKANISGKVDWQNGVEWDSQANLAQVNTKSLLPEWAAILSGTLHSKGYAGRGANGSDWFVEVDQIDIKGNLFQKNLQLQGALQTSHNSLLDMKNTQLIYGENRIVMQGNLGDKSHFSADIKAPNLKGLIPKLNASIHGNFRLLGKLTEPELDLDVIANNVSYDDFQLQHLTAKGKINTEKMIQGDLQLALKQFNYGEIKIANATAQAKGSEANHNLILRAEGQPVGANLQLTGAFDRKNEMWQGQLTNVNISTEMSNWRNDKAVSVAYHHKQIRADISAHCWQNPKLSLCFPRAFSAGEEGLVPFEIRQFNLTALQDYLDKNSHLSGIVNLKGDAAWFKNKAPQVNVELHSNALKFVQHIDYRKLPITLSPIKITANLADNQLKLKTDVKLENNGKLTSDLTMKDITGNRSLSGYINIDQITLKMLSPLLSKGESVNGAVNAKLTLGGSATSPQLLGTLNVTNLQAHAHAMPIDITGGQLLMRFNGTNSTLTGNVKTPDSELKIEGDANWHKLDAWHSRVKAQANRFKVAIPNLAKVEVSPNIEVKATPQELILGGNIDIPWARIEVEELPESAVTVSADEVIMESPRNQRKTKLLNDMPTQTKNGMAIKADVKINIGNDVRLEAYGLKTALNGTIAVKQGKQGLGLYGQVNLKQGTFASFGQDLVIRKGVITFAGLPSQPMLNIEAIRNPEAIEDTNVTAGVRVTGLADNPEVKLYSEPSLPQDQILSYILTGRSLESSGDAGSSNSIAAALLSMSLSKSSKLVGGIGSAFGLNDLNVTTAGIGDNTKVVASAGLSKNFRVKYGVGIFAPLTELTLRYRLAPNLYLQWMSSINQAVDLFYRFEF